MLEILEKKPKPEIIKVFFSNSSFRSLIDYFKKHKHDFEVSYTGYTAMIKNNTENKNYFLSKSIAKSPYKWTQKIKSEIKNSGIWMDAVSSKNIKYFKVNNIKPITLKKVYNVDIYSAYPSALKILGLISEKLFNELSKLEKIDRLKAIGMLATNKTVIIFKEGVQLSVSKKNNELMRNCWLALCSYTGEAIDKVRENLDSFLFYWFDGIYFTDKTEAKKCIDILKTFGFESKIEVLDNFTVKEKTDNLFITYGKGNDKKQFILPKNEKITYFS